jgi:hypothetical protein
MRDHVKILGVVNIVFGCLGVLAALAIAALFAFGGTMAGVAAQNDPDAIIAVGIMGALGTGLFILILVLSLPGIVAGWGLLNLKPWARILGIVLSALNLVNFPIGTAIGGYGLWVLLDKETEALFRTGPPQGMHRVA